MLLLIYQFFVLMGRSRPGLQLAWRDIFRFFFLSLGVFTSDISLINSTLSDCCDCGGRGARDGTPLFHRNLMCGIIILTKLSGVAAWSKPRWLTSPSSHIWTLSWLIYPGNHLVIQQVFAKCLLCRYVPIKDTSLNEVWCLHSIAIPAFTQFNHNPGF